MSELNEDTRRVEEPRTPLLHSDDLVVAHVRLKIDSRRPMSFQKKGSTSLSKAYCFLLRT